MTHTGYFAQAYKYAEAGLVNFDVQFKKYLDNKSKKGELK
jgi:hypothetical protein